MDIHHILIIVFFILAPIAILYFESKYHLVRKVGSVMVCYALGIIIGNMGILPEGIEKYQVLLTEITIPIALPLILFSLSVKRWLHIAGEAMISLIIGLFSVVVMIVVGYYFFGGEIEEGWKVGGMLTGIYTGGTPNMAAIKTALKVDHEVYIMTHTYEVFIGAVYMIFIFTIGQRVFLLFLPPFKKINSKEKISDNEIAEEFESYEGIFKRKTLLPLSFALLLSLIILAISFFTSKLFSEEFQTAAIILLITSFGIALSFVPRINKIEKTYQFGMYIVLIFCLVVASMADIRQLANISFNLFWFVGLAMFGSHILHALIAKIFKIDADTVIISGSALICSPPFVPAVAGAIKNREVILTGITVGIVGYAVGNYLG
ncbi:MAG: DUF819 family protein, partial [Bacteroidales bacterium]|nr:DUF819 family protein [Bacteroidales bacterium]